MAKKKNSSVTGWVIGSAALFALWSGAPAGVWVLIALFTAYCVYKLSKAPGKTGTRSTPTAHPYTAPSHQQRPDQPTPATSAEQGSYSIPAPPKDFPGPGGWLPLGKAVEVAGYKIPGGLLYVGLSLGDPMVTLNQPSLIRVNRSRVAVATLPSA